MNRPTESPPSHPASPFPHRGVVEGFYGPPWSHADRLWLLEHMGRWGLNRYLHAPKDDPRPRAQWRDAYPAEAMGEFRQLVERGGSAGVDAGFAVSPGLSIQYSSADDVAALCAKLASFRALGARFLGLCLDDVPTRLVHAADRATFSTLGAAHAALARAVAESLGPEVLLWVVPTDYLGTEGTDYLAELAEGVPPEIEIGWTGRTVVSPTIRSDEARARAATLGRRLLVWDNFPVADGPMRNMLHLGPLVGRDADLPDHVSGFLLNPMQHLRASAISLHTAAAYLRDPGGYDPEAAWRAALEELGAGAPEAFALFAAAHRSSALDPEDRDRELEAAWRPLAEELSAGAPSPATCEAVSALLEARAGAAESLRRDLEDTSLGDEIAPWLAAHETETRRMRAAVRAVSGMLQAPDRLARALAFFAFEGQLTRLPPPGPTSYGPRRVLYPQLVSMREDGAGFGADPALVRDRNLADEVVEAVEAWGLRQVSVA
ncbi:MAG: protein O-GlcNAcase [Myxococcota bacterium]